MDPQAAWTAVEAAERRKDSQLAHDFRLPIPFGVSDADALAMARRVAQRICDDLHTFVSIGLHRDSTVDAMGIAKPHDRVGVHAHLYFPTRRLVFQADASSGDGNSEGETGEGTWVLGDKLRVLSTKATAAACIERFNAEWAAAANAYAAAAGQVPDFSHLSYARLGLAKIPQLTLGAAATAMERRGERSWKGDRARASATPPTDIVVSSPIAGAAERLAARRADGEQGISRAWLDPLVPITVRRAPPLPSLSEGSPSGLAGRFLAELAKKPELPQPTPEQRSRLIAWLQCIEHALRRLAAIALRVADLRDRRRRDDGARATFLVELDDRRKRRAEARKAIADWLDAHPWQVRLAKIMGGAERRPPELMALEGSAAAVNTYVQQLKRGVADAEQRVAEMDSRIKLAEAEMQLMHRQVQAATASVVGLAPLYRMVLLSVADGEHTPALVTAMPEVSAPTEPASDAVEVVLRPAPRLTPGGRPNL
ncbi:hypothetical protein J2T07_000598 [Luteibacter jiangsuensis]|uniref:MobA/MobL protein domain-containing protein n=2 Tax=Luteibacter jiangsuensis TaxID=637577 RepID=A0ABT9SV70_9GAMM|nr:hypothetical protein [Luteibacter jiangsuensis]